MSSFYSLRIETDESKYEQVSQILGINIIDYSLGWIFETVLNDLDNIDVITEYLNLLENNYLSLEQIGVRKEDVSIWLIYEYYNQCNLEFAPETLKRLGENGIRFCISCYEGSL